MARRYRAVQQIPGQDPGLVRHLGCRAVADATEQMAGVLSRAVRRGELTQDQLTPRIARLPVDLVHHGLFLTAAAVTSDTLDEIVDDVFLPLLVYRTGAVH
jgi:hypothetical protein